MVQQQFQQQRMLFQFKQLSCSGPSVGIKRQYIFVTDFFIKKGFAIKKVLRRWYKHGCIFNTVSIVLPGRGIPRPPPCKAKSARLCGRRRRSSWCRRVRCIWSAVFPLNAPTVPTVYVPWPGSHCGSSWPGGGLGLKSCLKKTQKKA